MSIMNYINFAVGCMCFVMGISLLLKNKFHGIALGNIAMGIINFLAIFLKQRENVRSNTSPQCVCRRLLSYRHGPRHRGQTIKSGLDFLCVFAGKFVLRISQMKRFHSALPYTTFDRYIISIFRRLTRLPFGEVDDEDMMFQRSFGKFRIREIL